jgi:hypothetical protein
MNSASISPSVAFLVGPADQKQTNRHSSLVLLTSQGFCMLKDISLPPDITRDHNYIIEVSDVTPGLLSHDLLQSTGLLLEFVPIDKGNSNLNRQNGFMKVASNQKKKPSEIGKKP